MSSKPIRRCPLCSKNTVRRLISAGAGLIFKGSGFYITDHRDQGYKDKAKADAPAPADKSDAKTDSKSDSQSGAAAKPTEKSAEKSTEKSTERPAARSAAKSADVHAARKK